MAEAQMRKIQEEWARAANEFLDKKSRRDLEKVVEAGRGKSFRFKNILHQVYARQYHQSRMSQGCDNSAIHEGTLPPLPPGSLLPPRNKKGKNKN